MWEIRISCLMWEERGFIPNLRATGCRGTPDTTAPASTIEQWVRSASLSSRCHVETRRCRRFRSLRLFLFLGTTRVVVVFVHPFVLIVLVVVFQKRSGYCDLIEQDSTLADGAQQRPVRAVGYQVRERTRVSYLPRRVSPIEQAHKCACCYLVVVLRERNACLVRSGQTVTWITSAVISFEAVAEGSHIG